MLVAFSLGLLCGVVGALHAHTPLDRVLTSVLLIGISLPPFWVGLILIILFTLVLRWLPATGMLSATGGGPFDLLSHLVLPTITLAVVPLAVIARLTRANVLEVLGQLYVRTAHAKGLPPRKVVLRHVLSNTLVGTVTILGLEAAGCWPARCTSKRSSPGPVSAPCWSTRSCSATIRSSRAACCWWPACTCSSIWPPIRSTCTSIRGCGMVEVAARYPRRFAVAHRLPDG